jgi:Mg-chelatase subunit ChlD
VTVGRLGAGFGFGACGVFALTVATTVACDGAASGDELDAGGYSAVGSDPVFDEPPLAIPEDDSACIAETHRALSVPIDIALMLDSSGSMLNASGNDDVSKWDAVTTAIKSFLEDTRTEGVEVGLQYFPLTFDEAPEFCASQDDCGTFGPCSITFCSESGFPCATDADCASDTDRCEPYGQCEVGGGFCIGDGALECGGGNECIHVTEGFCLGQSSCDAAAYASPAVEIAPLEEVRDSILDSLDVHRPDGDTPTGPALDGLIRWAQANSLDNPHPTIAVLATDGVPTACDVIEVGQIAEYAAQGLAASSEILTYVIGVTGEEDNSLADLHTLARAGGTEEALLLSSDSDLTQSFLAALYDIRQASLSCAFDLPEESTFRSDYSKVNVEFLTPLSLPSVLYYVGSYDNCMQDQGGWYYNADPDAGETPTRIFLCDAVCGQLRAVTQARIDLRVGCARRDLR